MSATRLLVLGAVRIFQPAHGYLVRRELLSWDVENWAATNPGSIYNMLRTLTRDGLLAEVDTVDTADAGQGPGPGRLPAHPGWRDRVPQPAHRGAVGDLERDPYLLPAGLCFLTMLTRKQATEALEGREAAIEVRIRALEARSRMLLEQRRVPPHTVELTDLGIAHLSGELRLGPGRPGSGSRTATTGSPTSRGRWPDRSTGSGTDRWTNRLTDALVNLE